MHLRSTYGDLGAKLPGFLRGGVAAIAWFGLQNYAGSLALLILISKFWPGFLTIGGDFSFFGIDLPGLITFTIFWAINVLIGLGGGGVLNKFTAILNPFDLHRVRRHGYLGNQCGWRNGQYFGLQTSC